VKKFNRLSLIAAVVISAVACTNQVAESGSREQTQSESIWPKIDSAIKPNPELEQKVSELLARMTLEQKVAQMIQPEIRDISVEDMRRYGFGSYLNGGGSFPDGNKQATPQDWIALAEKMYQASIDDSLDGIDIPTMWGTDAVHGHNNVIGATLFPHNIGLGAANNPELIEKIAGATAKEVMATGIDWIFAPTVATVRDDRWGRTYEGYSEDPEIVKVYSAAIVAGLQGTEETGFLGDEQVISTVKHFVGDGGTEKGVDQGNNTVSEAELFKVHAQGYVGGLTAGAQSVMASFNSWNGEKIHGNHYLLTEVLKNKMGFDGFVVGDWNGHGQIAGCTNENCAQAANAGLDIYMAPGNWKALYENTLAQAKSGVIPLSRIDDAVTRILRVKFRAGLFDKPSPENRILAGKTELIGHPEHRKIAAQAVRESLVLLKNNNKILPLKPDMNILVAGDAADNIGKQSGGWTITWQGTDNQNSDFPGGTSIFDGIKQQVLKAGGQVELSEAGSYSTKPDVAIVVYGEEPYAEGHGDREHLVYQAENKSDLALLKKFRADGIPVISIFISGRPMWVNPELNASDAFIAAWLPGSEGHAIADVLLTDIKGQVQHDFSGKLSFSWPKTPTQIVNRFDDNYDPLFSNGYGLSYQDNVNVSDALTESYELSQSGEALVEVFDGKAQAPWSMVMFDQQDTLQIASNTAQLAHISYRTIDKVVQEDAFRLSFNQAKNAGIRFKADNAVDITESLDRSAVLHLNVKLNNSASGELFLAMGCIDLVECDKSVTINTLADNELTDEWQDIYIPLACLVNSTDGLAQLNSAVEVTATGTLELEVSEIEFINQTGVQTLARCQ